MKKIVWISLMIACLPFGLMAQNANDDLYFIPKKKTEKAAKAVVEKEKTSTTVYASPASTVVVKDVKGNVRDVDEYNRRYTSHDNTFMVENDTLYIEEKPYDERGEWVNGFEGSQSDYEYAMRIIRFRNPRFAVPVSSPLYWDVVYGLPSWEWNIFDDGFYAYVFPTYSNSLWWDWRYSWGLSWGSSWYGGNYWHYPHWGYSPWHYSSWHYSHWHRPYWYPTHSPHPHYGWVGAGGYWGNRYKVNGSTVYNPGIHAGRYQNNYHKNYGTSTASGRRVASAASRTNSDRYMSRTTQGGNRTGGTVRTSTGRVVTAKEGAASSSVRPQRQVNGSRNEAPAQRVNRSTGREGSVYTRPAEGKGSSYNRQSSTRSTVRNVNTSTQQNNGAAERGAYRSSSSSERKSTESRSSYQESRSSSSSSSRSSYSSGSSQSSRSSSAGGASRSGGGSSRGGGRR